MSDLRRFPVSDEFISYRQTLDSVCDRMDFFEFELEEDFFEFALVGSVDSLSTYHESILNAANKNNEFFYNIVLKLFYITSKYIYFISSFTFNS